MKRAAVLAVVLVVLAAVAIPVAAMALPLPPAPADGAKMAISPGEPSIYEYPTGSGTWYLDASVSNWPQFWYSSGKPVRQPLVSIQYLNASDTPVGGETFAVPAVVIPYAWSPSSLPTGYYRHIHHRLTLPAGAVPSKTRFTPEVNRATDPNWPVYHYGIAASTATPSFLYSMWTPSELDSTTLGGGRTILKFHVTNNGTKVVGPIGVTGNENYDIVPGDTHILDTFEVTPDDAFKASRLGPGDSTTFTLRGLRTTPTATTRSGPGSLIAEAYPLPPTTVWRFYNLQKGVHFYTANAAEADYVRTTFSSIYRFEDVAYVIQSADALNDSPLYRFFNLRSGTHFYTANQTEYLSIKTNFPTIMRDEGVAYFVSDTIGTPVYRFFNLKTSVHFYTADLAEALWVKATFPTLMRDEGVGYYLAAE